MQSQARDWGKIFAQYIQERTFISNIVYEELLNSIVKETIELENRLKILWVELCPPPPPIQIDKLKKS